MNKRIDAEIVPSELADLQTAAATPAAPVMSQDALLEQPVPSKKKLAKGKRKGTEADAEESSADAEAAEDAAGGSEAASADSGQLLAQAPTPPATTGAEKPAAAEGAASGGAAAGTEASVATEGGLTTAGVGVAAAAGVGLAAAGGGGGGAAVAGGVAAASTAFGGSVADGYIRDAQIFIDANRNGIAEASENTGVRTDAQGNFTLATPPTAPLIVIGGINIDTGLPNEVILKAPAGSTIVNPLTTILQEYLEANPSKSLATAQDEIKTAFGLPDVDLTTYDPLEQGVTDADALASQKVAAELAAMLTLAEEDGGSAALDAIIEKLVEMAGNGDTIDLVDPGAISDILADAGLDPATVNAITNVNNAINDATTLATDGPGSLSEVQEAFLNDENDAPVFVAPFAHDAALEGVTYSQQVYAAQAVDAEGDTITYSLDGASDELFDIDSSTGIVTIASDVDFESTPSFQIQIFASDGTNQTSQMVTINIADVNEPFTMADPTSTFVQENNESPVVVYSADIDDPDTNNQMTFTLGGDDATMFSVDANGVVSLNPGADYEGDGENLYFTLYAFDGANSDSREVVVTLTNVDEAVQFTNPETSFTVSEMSPTWAVMYSAFAADPEGDSSPVTYSILDDGESPFTIDGEGGIYLEDEFDFESSSFRPETIVVRAEQNGVATERTLTISYVDIDEAPQFTSTMGAITISENSIHEGVFYDVDAADPEGSQMTYWLGGCDALAFSIDESTGEITQISAFDYEANGPYGEFIVYAMDGTEHYSSQYVSFGVENINEAPTFSDPEFIATTVTENAGPGDYLVDLNANDPEGDSLTYSVSGEGANFTVDGEGALYLASEVDFDNGDVYALVTVTDSEGNADYQSVTVHVTDATVEWVDSTPAGLMENTSGMVVYTADIDDASEGPIPTFSIISEPQGDYFDIDPTSGVVTVHSPVDRESYGEVQFTVRATNGEYTLDKTVTIDVGDQNEYSPYWGLGATFSITAFEDTTIGDAVVSLNASDSDPEAMLTYSMTGDTEKYAINPSTGEVTLISALDYESGDTGDWLSVTVTDGLYTTSMEVQVNVGNFNDNPVYITSGGGDFTTVWQTEGATYYPTVYTVEAYDADNQCDLSYSFDREYGDDWDYFSIYSNGAIVYNGELDSEYRSHWSLKVLVEDSANGVTHSDYQYVSVMVNPVAEAATNLPPEPGLSTIYPWSEDLSFSENSDFISVAEGSSLVTNRTLLISELNGFEVETPFNATIDANGKLDLDEAGNDFIDALITGGGTEAGLDGVTAIADYMLDIGEIAWFGYDDGHAYIVVDTTDDPEYDGALGGVMIYNGRDEVEAIRLVEGDGYDGLQVMMHANSIGALEAGSTTVSGTFDMRFSEGADYVEIDEDMSVAGQRDILIEGLSGFSVTAAFHASIDAFGIINVDQAGNQFVDSQSSPEEQLAAINAIADALLNENEIAAFNFGDGNARIVTDADGEADNGVVNILQLQYTQVYGLAVSEDPTKLWVDGNILW